MTEAKTLKLFSDYAKEENTKHHIEQRKLTIRKTVEKYLPQLVEGVKMAAKKEDISKLMMHQDAFASEYQDDEVLLLGMAIKYAGMYGVSLIIVPND